MIVKILRKVKYAYRHYQLTQKFGNRLLDDYVIASNAQIIDSTLNRGSRVASLGSVMHSVLGRYTSVGRNSKVSHSEIGSFCAISWDATINATSHPLHSLSISAFPYVPRVGEFVKEEKREIKKVYIGHDVWIGAHTVVMPGIKIGHGAVVGAGAIVTKNVPPYSIVAGAPGKVIKYRFNELMVEKLLKLEWWNLEECLIRDSISLFQGEFTDEKLKQLEDLVSN